MRSFVFCVLALITTTGTPWAATMMVLHSVSLDAVNVTQVSIWPPWRHGHSHRVLLDNILGNTAGVAGPVSTAYLKRWTGSWAGALIGVALAGVAAAML